MVVRQSTGLATALLSLFIGVSATAATPLKSRNSIPKTNSAAATSASEEKFQEELQSLLGAAVRTKYGEMSIRQKKDEFGNVRKQILVGERFVDIQIDEDGDGSVDYWSVENGDKMVEASNPQAGNFVRLVIHDRFDAGVQKSTYVLKKDGRSYSLVSTKFTGKEVRAYSESEGAFDSFEASAGGASANVPVAVGAAVGNVPVLLSPSVFDAKRLEYQATILGKDAICQDSQSLISQRALNQRQWWDILDHESRRQKAQLAEEAKKMFDSTCKNSEHKAELDQMSTALAGIMLSSSKGEAPSGYPVPPRGDYLTCLDRSGMGLLSTRIEATFMRIQKEGRKTPLLRCDFMPGAGLTIPAYVQDRQITIQMMKGEAGRGKNSDGSPQNYQNVIFHELLHVGGLDETQEALAHAAQACCGAGADDRLKACNKLDDLVAADRRYTELEDVLMRAPLGMAAFLQKLENEFGAEGANKVRRAYIQGFDKKDGSIFNAQMFDACVKKDGEQACRAQWQAKIEDYTHDFFTKKVCRDMVLGSQVKSCDRFSDEAQRGISQTVLDALIVREAPPVSADGKFGSCPARTSAEFEMTRPDSFVAELLNAVFGTEAFAQTPAENLCPFSIPVSAYEQPARNRALETGEITASFSRSISVDGLKNRATISPIAASLDVVGTKTRTVVTPSGPSVADVASENRTGTTGGGKRPTAPIKSPLPVTKVDTQKAGRTLVEDRYRRATDFVGSATRGLGRFRAAILPAAVAAAEQSSSGSARSRNRLASDASFVAFKPEKGEKLSVSIENPFAASRSIASVGDSGSGGSKSSSQSGLSTQSGSIGAAVSTNVPTGAARAEGAQAKGGVAASASSSPAQARVGGNSSAAASASPGAAGGKASAKIGDKAATEKSPVLDGLFRLPYAQIEPRLSQLPVVEALIVEKTSITDAQKRRVGSNQPTTCYEFAGMNRPLRRLPTCAVAAKPVKE